MERELLPKEIMDGYNKFIEENVNSVECLYKSLSDLNDNDRSNVKKILCIHGQRNMFDKTIDIHCEVCPVIYSNNTFIYVKVAGSKELVKEEIAHVYNTPYIIIYNMIRYNEDRYINYSLYVTDDETVNLAKSIISGIVDSNKSIVQLARIKQCKNLISSTKEEIVKKQEYVSRLEAEIESINQQLESEEIVNESGN